MDWLFFLSSGAVAIMVIAGLSLTITIAAEMLWPRRTLTAPIGARWGNNLTLAVITWYGTNITSFAIMLAIAGFTENQEWGLFQHYDTGFLLPFFTLLVVAQLFSYVTHIMFHRIPLLWPLHAVHHSDTDVDISTSYRHHPLEPLIFMPLFTPVILLLGVPVEAIFAYQVLHIFLTFFSHSNMRLPPLLDRYLSAVIVTPDYHRVHHSSDVTYTNSNYGGVVPWFDYLFGTAKKRDFCQHESFELGLEYDRDSKFSRIDKLLLSPFRSRPEAD
ncbi:MAG: sterol desaturase/sphingolipid hydroxylase (fatty acid hydroxylase superfamily) [Halioglobus sp.]